MYICIGCVYPAAQGQCVWVKLPVWQPMRVLCGGRLVGVSECG